MGSWGVSWERWDGKQVQAGATLVNHAGDSIAQLVQSVRQVSSIMAEITAQLRLPPKEKEQAA